MPTFFKDHDNCRRTVCVICMKKSDREISKHFISEIHCLILSDVNFQDERVPLGICVTCRWAEQVASSSSSISGRNKSSWSSSWQTSSDKKRLVILLFCTF